MSFVLPITKGRTKEFEEYPEQSLALNANVAGADGFLSARTAFGLPAEYVFTGIEVHNRGATLGAAAQLKVSDDGTNFIAHHGNNVDNRQFISWRGFVKDDVQYGTTGAAIDITVVVWFKPSNPA